MTDYLLDDSGLAEFKKKYDARIKNTTSEIMEAYNDSNSNCGIVGAKGLFDLFGGLIFGVNEEGEPGFRVGFDGEFISFGGKCLMEKLLWTNPDIAQTSFDEQTVEIDLSSFDYVGIEYWHNGQGSDVKISVFPIHNNEQYWAAIASSPTDFSSDRESYPKHSPILPIRPIIISKNFIKFYETWWIGVDGNNDWSGGGGAKHGCVPIRIFALQ